MPPFFSTSKRPSPNSDLEHRPTKRDLRDVPRALQVVVDDAEALDEGQRGPAGDADDAHPVTAR